MKPITYAILTWCYMIQKAKNAPAGSIEQEMYSRAACTWKAETEILMAERAVKAGAR